MSQGRGEDLPKKPRYERPKAGDTKQECEFRFSGVGAVTRYAV